MSIDIARRVRVSISDARVRRIVMVTMRSIPSLGVRGGEGELRGGAEQQNLSVAFVGPREMRRLNRTYHAEDRVTDVLAFRLTEERRTKVQGTRSIRKSSILQPFDSPSDLGELIVCPSYVKQGAKRAGESFRRELTSVLVHGTLHLLGYDHATPRDAEHMFGKQEYIVRGLNRGV